MLIWPLLHVQYVFILTMYHTYHGYSLYLLTAVTYRSRLLQLLTAVAYRSYLPQSFTAVTYHSRFWQLPRSLFHAAADDRR